MAVFIKRERLGSRPPPRETRLKQTIESLPTFRALQQSLAVAKGEKQADLQEKWESNAEVQEWRRKTSEEKGREAIERMVPTAKEVVSMRKGSEATYEEARSYAEGLANKSDRQKKGE